MTDFRDQIAAELTKAGVPPRALDDATLSFETKAQRGSDGWRVDSTFKASLPHAIKKFLEARPHFAGSEPTDDEPEEAPEDNWPKDADGKRIPVGEMLDDQLWEAAGEPPEGYYQQKPLWDVKQADFASSGIEPLDEDEYEADELRPPKDGKRYSKSEVDAMDSDQLFAAAGSAPEK